MRQISIPYHSDALGRHNKQSCQQVLYQCEKKKTLLPVLLIKREKTVKLTSLSKESANIAQS